MLQDVCFSEREKKLNKETIFAFGESCNIQCDMTQVLEQVSAHQSGLDKPTVQLPIW